MIEFNSLDWDGMIALMDEYGDSEMPFVGKNDVGEITFICIFNDRISVKTLQDNDFIRIDTFWRDGTIETTFDH